MNKCIRYGTKEQPFLVKQMIKILDASQTYTALIVPAKIIKLIKNAENDGKKFWLVAEPEVPVGDADAIALSDGINHIKIYTDAGVTKAATNALINIAGKRKRFSILLESDSSSNRSGRLVV